MGEENNDKNQIEEPAEITMLWNLFTAEKFQDTIFEAEKYIATHANADRTNANKLIGLASFRLMNYAKSEKIFVALAHESDSFDDWFNVLTSSTMNKNIDLSEIAFEKVLKSYTDSSEQKGASLPQVYLYYMQALRDVKEYEKALHQFSQLLKYYMQVHITDSTFLYMRGIPFFEHAIDASKKILENNDKVKVERLLDELQNKIDEEGIKYV